MVIITSYVLDDGEVIKHQQDNTTVLMNDRNIGKGTLYITESRVSWMNSSTREGFSLDYPMISLHAVSRTPVECLYMMLDTDHLPVNVPGYEKESDSEGDDSDDDAEDGQNTVLKFLPDDSGSLDTMYQAMNHCQALHPDPDQQSDSDNDNIFVDADGEGEAEGQENGQDEGEYDEAEEFEQASNGNGQDADEGMEVDAAQFEDADSEVDN